MDEKVKIPLEILRHRAVKSLNLGSDREYIDIFINECYRDYNSIDDFQEEADDYILMSFCEENNYSISKENKELILKQLDRELVLINKYKRSLNMLDFEKDKDGNISVIGFENWQLDGLSIQVKTDEVYLVKEPELLFHGCCCCEEEEIYTTLSELEELVAYMKKLKG